MREIYLHEIRSALASGMGMIAFITMLAAFIVSLGMMHQEYERRLQNYNSSLSLPNKDLFFNQIWYYKYENGDTTNSQNITLPMGKVKAPQPLLFIARGLDTEMRQAVDFLSGFPIIDMNVQPDQERNLLSLLFPAPDLLFMIRTVVTLLAMIAGYSLICGEREAGTLKLVLTTGISRAAVFGGKFLGSLTVVSIAFVLSFLCYVILLGSAVPLFADPEVLARLALILTAGLLTIAVSFSLAVAVSSMTRSTAQSLVVTLFLWLLLVFTIPGLTSLAAQQAAQVDSDEKIARVKFEKATSMEREYSKAHPGSDHNYTGSYGARHDEIRPQINAEMKKIDDEHARRSQKQMSLTTELARFSPVGSLTFAVTGLSRSGLQDYLIYREDLQAIKSSLDSAFTSIVQDPKFQELFAGAQFDLPKEAQELVFNWFDSQTGYGFRSPGLDAVWSQVWIDYGLLAGISILLAGFAFFRFSRYDVR